MNLSDLLVPVLSAVFGAGGGVGAAAGYFRAREMRRASEVRALTATRVEEEHTEQATLQAVSTVRAQEVIAERAAIEAANNTVQAMIRGLLDQNRELHDRIGKIEAAATASRVAVESAARESERELKEQRDKCHEELVGVMAIAQDAAARVEGLSQELASERSFREQQEKRYEELIAEIRRHHAS